MQNITREICTATPEGREVQLEDKRDGNKYWVGKMKDDRCWMLQNLALGNTSSAITLTSTDSDITSDWNLPKSLASVTSGSTSTAAVQSWSLGKWVLATPLLTAGCGNNTSGLSGCIKVGFVDVSDTTKFQPTYTATTRSWEGANPNSSTLVTVNCTTWSGSGTSKKCTAGTYDAHYLVGNYYSWNAAVAGTGGSGSICPKGWKLPVVFTAGQFIGVGDKDFADLLVAYGVDSSLSGTPIGGTTTYNIAGTPLRFVRSGGINPTSHLGAAGQGGGYWSSTPVSGGTNAYRSYFNDSSIDSSNSYYRQRGSSVRCVAESDIIIVKPPITND